MYKTEHAHSLLALGFSYHMPNHLVTPATSPPATTPTAATGKRAGADTPTPFPFLPTAPEVETVAFLASATTVAKAAPATAPITIPFAVSIYVQQRAVEYCISNTGILRQFLGLLYVCTNLIPSGFYNVQYTSTELGIYIRDCSLSYSLGNCVN